MKTNKTILYLFLFMAIACTDKEKYVELPKDKPDLSLCPCLMQVISIDSARNCDLNLSDKELRDLGKYCFFHKEEWKKDTLDKGVK